MPIGQITSSVAFQDPQGNALANGKLTLDLSQDAKVTTNGQVAPRRVYITLDASGKVPAGTNLWANDLLTPSGTVYVAKIYDQNTNLVYGPENWSITGASPVDVSAINPLSVGSPLVTTANLSSLTVGNIDNIIYLDGTHYTTLAGAYAAIPSGGGTVIVPPNYTETLTANLVLSKNNSGFLFTGPATITMGTNSVTMASGINGAFIRFVAGGRQAVKWVYTGTATALDFGDASADTVGLDLQGLTVDISGAGSGAIGFRFRRIQGSPNLNTLQCFGSGGSTTQIGFSLDGTGSFCGDNAWSFIQSSLVQTGVKLMNAQNNDFRGFNSIAANAAGTCLDFNSTAISNTGTFDIENQFLAANFASTARNNDITIHNEGNTTDAAFGTSSFNRIRFCGSATTGPVVTDNGTNNSYTWMGSAVLLNQQNSAGALTGNAADQVMFTYTIPTKMIGPGKGFRVKAYCNHSSGTTSVTYKLRVGGSAIFTQASTGVDNGATEGWTVEFFNQANSQTAQNVIAYQAFRTANVANVNINENTIKFGTTAINFANSQTVDFTFNVANTDQVAPKFWLVELIS